MGKKLILYIFLTFVFSSCVSQRVTKEHSEYERQELINRDNVTFRFDDLFQTSRISRIDTSIFDFSVSFEIYDTEKKIDDLGNYPIKAKGLIEGHSKDVSVCESSDTNIETTNERVEVNESEYVATKAETDVEKERTSEYKTLFLSTIIAFFIILAIIKITK